MNTVIFFFILKLKTAMAKGGHLDEGSALLNPVCCSAVSLTQTCALSCLRISVSDFMYVYKTKSKGFSKISL